MGILFLSREKGMKGEKSKEQRAKSTEKKRARKAERARRARRKTLYAFYAFTDPTRKPSLSKEWQMHLTSLFLGTQKAKSAAY